MKAPLTRQPRRSWTEGDNQFNESSSARSQRGLEGGLRGRPGARRRDRDLDDLGHPAPTPLHLGRPAETTGRAPLPASLHAGGPPEWFPRPRVDSAPVLRLPPPPADHPPLQ